MDGDRINGMMQDFLDEDWGMAMVVVKAAGAAETLTRWRGRRRMETATGERLLLCPGTGTLRNGGVIREYDLGTGKSPEPAGWKACSTFCG